MACHSGGARTGSISLNFGEGAAGYQPGATYPLAITISDPVAKRFGFSMVARSPGNQDVGTFTASGPATGTQSRHVGHRDAPEFATAPGTHTFTVQWRAPASATTPVTFYFSGNAANGNDSSSGDSIYFSSLSVPVAQPPNQAPSVTVPDQVVQATTGQTTEIRGVILADADAGTGTVEVALAVDHGVLVINESVAGGLPAAGIAANGTGSVKLTGPLAALNATLADSQGVVYTSRPGFSGADAVRITVDDKGNTGSGGPLTATGSVAIQVAFLTFASWQSLAFPEGTAEGDRAPDADPDFDLRPNALEFFSGGHPMVPDTDWADVEATEDAFLAVFPRSRHVDPSLGRPQWSTDLLTWTTEGLEITPAGEASSTVELIEVRLPKSLITGDRAFFVWRVLIP